MSVNKNAKGPIILVNMFSGSFLDENIAHEIINIFRTDDTEENYVYLPRNGNMSSNVIKRAIKKGEPVRLVMVHRLEPYRFEVLGRAIVDSSVYLNEQGTFDFDDFYKPDRQEALLDSIKYGGVSVKSVMEAVGQRFDGGKEKVTFKVMECLRPKYQVVINNIKNEGKRGFEEREQEGNLVKREGGFPVELNILMLSRESQSPRNIFRNHRAYVLPKGYEIGETRNGEEEDFQAQPYAYDQLDALFTSDEGWESFPTVDEFRAQHDVPCSPEGRFLSLLNREDSELAYSNLLAYFLDESDELSRLFLELLFEKSDSCLAPAPTQLIPLDIARERKHIDILIDTLDRVLILENKVNARLDEDGRQPYGGNRKPAGGQLQRYVDEIVGILRKKQSENLEDGRRVIDKKISVFIICPTRSSLYQEYKKYCESGGREGLMRYVFIADDNNEELDVSVISYGEILKVLTRFSKESIENSNLPYFNDFIDVLEWQENGHFATQSGRLLNVSHKRFLRALEIAKAQELVN